MVLEVTCIRSRETCQYIHGLERNLSTYNDKSVINREINRIYTHSSPTNLRTCTTEAFVVLTCISFLISLLNDMESRYFSGGDER